MSRFKNVPSLEDIGKSFAAGIQYAIDHPDEVAEQEAAKQARFLAILEKHNAGPVAGALYRTTSPVVLEQYDADTAARVVRTEEFPAGSLIRFTGEKHHLLSAFRVAHAEGEGSAATQPSDWPGLFWVLRQHHFAQCERVDSDGPASGG